MVNIKDKDIRTDLINPYPNRKSSGHLVGVVKRHIGKGKSTLAYLVLGE